MAISWPPVGCRQRLRTVRPLTALRERLHGEEIRVEGADRRAGGLLFGGEVLAGGRDGSEQILEPGTLQMSRMRCWLRPRDISGHDGPRDEEGEPP